MGGDGIIIYGEEYLDKNNFDSVVVSRRSIFVNSDDRKVYSGSNYHFCDKIRNLSVKDAVNSLIDYFLEYSDVVCIDYSRTAGNFISLYSDAGRKISVDRALSKNMLNKIENNYNNKRFQLLLDSLDSDCTYIFLLNDGSRKCVRASDFKNDVGEGQLIFELSGYNDEDVLLPKERKFLSSAVDLILGDRYIRGEESCYFDDLRKTLNCRVMGNDGKLLVYPDSLKKYFNRRISIHNSKIKNNEAKQFKLEGF